MNLLKDFICIFYTYMGTPHLHHTPNPLELGIIIRLTLSISRESCYHYCIKMKNEHRVHLNKPNTAPSKMQEKVP